MKRYVKAAYGFEAERLRKLLKALKHDLAILTTIETEDDFNQADFYGFKWNKVLDSVMLKNNGSFEDSIDYLIDYAMDWYKKTKDELKETASYEEKSAQLYQDILDFLLHSDYDVESEDGTNQIIYVRANGSIVEFCDIVKDLIGGNYYGTARGGSWTTWNLLSEDRIRVDVGQAGPGKTGSWKVEVK